MSDNAEPYVPRVGDRVRLVREVGDSHAWLEHGDEGVVVHGRYHPDDNIGVQWDRSDGCAHGCAGHCPHRHGWYVFPEVLVLVSRPTGAAEAPRLAVPPICEQPDPMTAEDWRGNEDQSVTRVIQHLRAEGCRSLDEALRLETEAATAARLARIKALDGLWPDERSSDEQHEKIDIA